MKTNKSVFTEKQNKIVLIKTRIWTVAKVEIKCNQSFGRKCY